MKEHGIGDEANIKEIISEVDTDNVSYLFIYFQELMQQLSCSHFCTDTISTTGWENQLHRILCYDEKWAAS